MLEKTDKSLSKGSIIMTEKTDKSLSKGSIIMTEKTDKNSSIGTHIEVPPNDSTAIPQLVPQPTHYDYFALLTAFITAFITAATPFITAATPLILGLQKKKDSEQNKQETNNSVRDRQ